MKSSDEVKKLQRSLKRLRTVGGRPLRVGGHLFVVHASAILDPERLLSAVGAALPEAQARAVLQGALRLAAPKRLDPVAFVDARWLGEVRRDFKLLRDTPAYWALLREHARDFRDPPDPRDLPAWEEQIERLTTLRASSPPRLAGRLERILALAEAFHGHACAGRLASLHARSLAARGARLQAGRRRIAQALQMLRGDEPRGATEPERTFLAQQVDALKALRRLPGRARRKKIGPIVARLILGTAAEEPLVELPDTLRLADAVDEALLQVAAWLRQQLPHAPDLQEDLLAILATYGLRFPPGTEPPPLTAEQLPILRQRWGALREELPEANLSFEQATGLALRLERSYGLLSTSLKRAARWLEQGLRLEELDDALAAPGLHAAWHDWDASTLQAYLRWAGIFRGRGVKEALDPSLFVRLWSQRRGDLTLLASALVQTPSQGSDAQALLDLLLAMADRLPAHARQCLQVLHEERTGLGKRRAPEFTAWIGDEALVDRYLYLREALGEPVEVARGLLRDFLRAGSRQRQLDHLKTAPSLRPAQQAAALALATAEAPVSPDWTIRRLRDRVGPLSARLLRSTLDRALQEIFREVFRLELPAMTPRWRDLARLALSLGKNRLQLALLLRTALERPGSYCTPSLPENRAWIERARGRMNVDAWLSRRRAVVSLGGQPFSLECEDDPLEALRMGVPFGTCLSIEGGGNMHAAVLNALDVNKRVLYLRSSTRAVVGRQLLAISTDFRLLGYRVYSALPEHLRDQVTEAFRAFTDGLQRELGIPLGDTGRPETIHGGDWYDDRPVPWDGSGTREEISTEELARCCRELGLPVPQGEGVPPAELRCRRAQAARDFRALAEALPSLHPWCPEGSYLYTEFCRWLGAEMGESRLRREAAGDDGWMFLGVVLHLDALRGHRALLESLRELGLEQFSYNTPGRELSYTPGPITHPEALRRLGRQYFERRRRVDLSGASSMFHDASGRLMGMPMRVYFDLCDALYQAREDVQRCSSEEDLYFDWSEGALLAMAPLVFLLSPEAPQVARCLDATQRSPWAVQAAAQIAGLLAFPVDDGPGMPTLALLLGLDRQDSLRLDGALRRRLRVQPSLEGIPEVEAAMLAAYGGLFDRRGPWESLLSPEASLIAFLEDVRAKSPSWAFTWGLLARLWRGVDTPGEGLLSWTKGLLDDTDLPDPVFSYTPLDVVARMATHPGLFSGLLARVDVQHWWTYSKHGEALERKAVELGLDVEPFLTRWAGSVGQRQGERGPWQQMTTPVCTSREQTQKLFRRLVHHAHAERWMPLYQRLGTACECALVLEELRSSGKLREVEAWQAARTRHERSDGHNDFWLEALIRGG